MKNSTRTRRYHGFTVIEAALVIAVLLALISVVFFGVSAYKDGQKRVAAEKNAAGANVHEHVQLP